MNGDEEVYNQIYKLLEETEDYSLKLKTLSALGSTKNVELLKKTLELTLNEKLIRRQDCQTGFFFLYIFYLHFLFFIFFFFIS